MSILNTWHKPCHPCQAQHRLFKHFSSYVDGKNSSRSQMSLSVIYGVPINRVYGHPATNNN